MTNILQFTNFVYWAELKELTHEARLVITESFPWSGSQGRIIHLSDMKGKAFHWAPLCQAYPTFVNVVQGIPEKIHIFFLPFFSEFPIPGYS